MIRVPPWFSRIALRSDLAVAALLILTVLLMILPLPTVIVDVLLACNMSISIVLLMVAFYLRSAVDLTTLPSIILMATVFRLALSIAVTRLVLGQADAGDIIRTFGEFVVGGNIVVGLVIFLIITVVQFVVITKGAERVAEVAARFTLDALPGKQMAIDADVRAGELDQAGARSRRSHLERESQLYGAMDGAMKFVKGDAIAGLIIIVVNLVGGLAIGVLQRGMPFAQAGHTYSILTIGDGLVAQIPALFIAITSGVVVTRVSGGEADNLGGEIVGQLGRDTRAITLAGVVAAGMGLVPGFPKLVFFGVGGMLILGGWLGSRRKAADIAAVELVGRTEAAEAIAPSRVQLLLSSELAGWLPPAAAAAALARANGVLSADLGITIPAADVRVDSSLEGHRFRLEVDAVNIAEGSIPERSALLIDNAANARLAGMQPERGDELPGQPEPFWVPDQAQAGNEGPRVATLHATEALARAVTASLRRIAGQFVGIQETRAMLSRMEGEWGDLVREAQKAVPLQRSAELFRRLLDDGLGLRNLRGLLESMVEHGSPEQEAIVLAEAVRLGLRRQICQGVADPARVIAAFIIDNEAEATIRGAVRQTPAGTFLALPEGTASALVERIRFEAAASRGPGPVVLTAQDVRRHVRNLLVNNGLEIPVLSFHDLLPEYTVQPLATVRIPNGADLQQAA